jgi:hypothetical protein
MQFDRDGNGVEMQKFGNPFSGWFADNEVGRRDAAEFLQQYRQFVEQNDADR